MSRIIDCRGLACPQPVVQTKQALEQDGEIQVIVDNAVARENVTRFGKSQGCAVSAEEKQDGIYLHITKLHASESKHDAPPAADAKTGPIVSVIPSDQMGRGEPELGAILMRSFMHTVTEIAPSPNIMIFFNTGVKLTAEGSEVLEDLKALEKKGAQILVCGTCLDYLGLKEKIAVGQISNMYAISEAMLSAGRIISV